MKRVLPVIVISQFFCTSLWFAGNAVMKDISVQLTLDPSYLVHLASAVQFGFITGTLVFAVLSFADRFSPTRVFLLCALICSAVNLAVSLPSLTAGGLLAIRFLTGFFLAGIYPVGMKIAADHFQKGLGKSLGFLVGALTLGTAFPHLVKGLTEGLPWQWVIFSTSALAATGGAAMILLVPDGPYRIQNPKFRWNAFLEGFKIKAFRQAAFGYFGHMWELYAFWVFVPVILAFWKSLHPAAALNIPLLSFLIIASGSPACVISGYVAQWAGARRTAAVALTLSGLCCLVSPLLLMTDSSAILVGFLFFWSVVVIADSPLFSTLVAQSAPEGSKGAALTVVTCIGFAVTIISIQMINALRTDENAISVYALLAAGPVVGLAFLYKRPGTADRL